MKRYRSRLAQKRASNRRRRLAIGTLVIVLVWFVGFLKYAENVSNSLPEEEIRHTDAVVVLTGGALRVTTGLAVLSTGKADKLLISGVHEGFQKRFLHEMARDAGIAGDLNQIIECCVTLGSRARDTVGNAQETAEWVAQNKIISLRLVTAGYHMERSLIALRKVIPNLTILAHPVTPPDVAADHWFRSPRTIFLLAGEFTKLLVSKSRRALHEYLTSSNTVIK